MNIDLLISLMDNITNSSTKDEFSEQEGGDTSTDASATKPDYPTVTKWESGVTRGAGNQIGNTKWSDSYKITRGKANTLI